MNKQQFPEDQFIKVGSVNTRYWLIGKKGTIVILVHGLGGFAENWMFNIDALAKHFQVYVLDLVGFGKSDKPKASYTYGYFAQFLNDFMEIMKIENANLIGHSLGGGIILQFALKFPDKVNKLVLVSSAGLGKEVSNINKVISLPIIGELLTRPSRKGTAKLYKELVYDETVIPEEMIELGYQMSSLPGAQKVLLKTNREKINFFGFKPRAMDSIRFNLDKISSPTLIIWGQQDNMVPVSHAHVAKENIPKATLKIFENCGHAPTIEFIEEFNSSIIKFLSVE